MSRQLLCLGALLLVCAAVSGQETVADSPNSLSAAGIVPPAPVPEEAPAPAPEEAAAAEDTATAALAPPPPPVYAPKRSFGQWVRDLKHDPTILIAFIVSLLSGLGFLFVIYALCHEMFMGIPYGAYSFKSSNRPQQPSPASSMDVKMQTMQ